MAVLMAGRTAEEMIFGEGSTGASDDLAKATDIARECVMRYGMDEKIGAVVLEEKILRYLGDRNGSLQPREYSEDTAREVDLVVRQLVAEAKARAKAILTQRLADLKTGAQLLLDQESLTPDAFPPLRHATSGQGSLPAPTAAHA